MNRVGALLILYPLLASAQAPSGFPFEDEVLTYSIVWPSGLSLGEAKLASKHNASKWAFDLGIDAAIPGYLVKDTYHSFAGLDLCAAEFYRETLHGTKRISEKTTIADGKAVRQTRGGGKGEISVPKCGHDALTYLFFTRQQLGQGKIPPPETILFGAGYRLELKYTGEQTIPSGNVPTQTDRVTGTVNLRDNETYQFEIFFARDAARTPLLIRAPFALGAISMELVH
jgi:hypothetical protein